MRELPKLARDGLDGKTVFTLFDTYGFPPELSVEEAAATGIVVDPGWQAGYERLMAEQRERSRTAAAGMFKGRAGRPVRGDHPTTYCYSPALRSPWGHGGVELGIGRVRFVLDGP